MEVAKFTVAKKSTSSSQQCQVHVDLFFSNIKGIVHKEFVPPGQTINGKFYCEVLKRLREHITCCLLFDNSWLPKTLQWPPHSPDLAPCDFFLFPKMKLRVKGRRFDTTKEIHAETQEVIDIHSHLRTSRGSWNHGKHAGIAVYMSKGTTSKETVETRSYGKKLFLWSNSLNFWVAPRRFVCVCLSFRAPYFTSIQIF